MATRRTLGSSFRLEGAGIHGGEPCAVEVRPGPWGSGLVFETEDERFRADGTAVEAGDGLVFFGESSEVGGVEALFACFAALGITDAVVAVDGDELPALDGTARPWLAAIDAVGRVDGPDLAVPTLAEPVFASSDDGYAAWLPAEERVVAVRVDAGPGAVGEGLLPVDEALFRDELAWAREVLVDLDALHDHGRWLGATDANAAASEAALASPDEGVRRRMVHALAALAVIGPGNGRLELVGVGFDALAQLIKAV